MNVQEINETGHSIWGFAVTALALLSCSGFGWALWRASGLSICKKQGQRLVNYFKESRDKLPKYSLS